MSLSKVLGLLALVVSVASFAGSKRSAVYPKHANYDYLDAGYSESFVEFDPAIYRANGRQDFGYNYGPQPGLGGGYGISQMYGYGYTDTAIPAQELAQSAYGPRGYGYGGYGFGQYQPNSGMSVRFNDGGYGDRNYANFNLNACTHSKQQNCTAEEPNAGEYEWRFLRDIGWRKMATYDAARKDWWDYKRSVPLPFNYFNFPRFGVQQF